MRKLLLLPLLGLVAVSAGCVPHIPGYDNLGSSTVAGAASSSGQVPSGSGVAHNLARMFWQPRVSTAVAECIKNSPGGTVIRWVHHDTPIRQVADTGAVLNTSMRAASNNDPNGPVMALAFGCKTPGYESAGFGGTADRAIYMNMDYRWNVRKMCTVMAHEVGHQTGRQHNDGSAIMGVPVPHPGNGYPNWNWDICGTWLP